MKTQQNKSKAHTNKSPSASNGTILIVGAGSIGRRHLKNLQTLGQKKLVLYRTGKSTLPDEEIIDIPQEDTIAKALAYKPVATIIANPSALHMPIALAAARAGSHLFVEKPISHTLDGVEDLARLALDRGLIVQVGFQFRFHPGLLKIKRLLEESTIGPIVGIQAHWGEHLPSFHPWEDYRKSYAAKKELGGGVLLTLCHPFDYLRWLLGEVESVCAIQNRSDLLKIDVEETVDVLLHFKNGVIGNVHLDYWERPGKHFLHIVGQNGIIHLDLLPDKEERNKMFVAEMKHFLSCVFKKNKPLCTLNDGIEALRIVLAAKESARKKRLIEL